MSTNVRMLHDEIPAYQLAKRARLDQLAHESQREERASLTVAGVVVLMVLGTLIALIWAKQAGWW